MGVVRGLNITTDGLVFGMDTGYPVVGNAQNSIYYKGKPTDNLIALAGSDTKIERSGTSYPYYSANITSLVQQRWSPTNNVIAMSFEGKRDYVGGGTGSGGDGYPRMYTYFSDWSWSRSFGTGAYDWALATSVGAMPDPTGKNVYFAIYHMNSGNRGRSYSRNHMVSFSNHVPPYINGSRSNTNSMIDLARTSTINLSNVSFNNTGLPIFDGTNDYIDTTKTASQLGVYNSNYTMESVFKLNSTSGDNMVFGTNETVQYRGLHNGVRNGVFYHAHYSADRNAGSASPNTWYHVVWKHTGSQSIMYVNGVAINSLDSHAAFLGTTNIWIGRHWGWFNGDIAVAKIYNRDLTEAEIRQNYLAYKYRFGLS